MNTIYVFQNGMIGDDLTGDALADDGVFLAGHISSSEAWLKHDMGVTSTRKHEIYAAHFPDGFEVVFVERDAVRERNHAGLEAAYALFLKKNATTEGATDGQSA